MKIIPSLSSSAWSRLLKITSESESDETEDTSIPFFVEFSPSEITNIHVIRIQHQD